MKTKLWTVNSSQKVDGRAAGPWIVKCGEKTICTTDKVDRGWAVAHCFIERDQLRADKTLLLGAVLDLTNACTSELDNMPELVSKAVVRGKRVYAKVTQ